MDVMEERCGKVLPIDVGGSHISTAIPRWEGGRVVIDPRRVIKVDFPAKGTAEDVTKALLRVIFEACRASEVRAEALYQRRLAISVGTPGPIDKRNQTVGNTPNAVPLRNYPIGQVLRAIEGVMAVGLANDGNAHANGVLHSPEAAGITDAWVLALGSGVGAGMLIDGRLVEGPRGNAAEGGHFPFRRLATDPILRCGCGADACVEAYLGAERICAYAAAAPSDSVLYGCDKVTVEAVFDAADKYDRWGLYVFDLMMRALADLIGTLCKISNPDAVFLCGGIANAGDRLVQAVQERLKPPELMDPLFLPHIQIVQAPETTALLGLTYLGLDLAA